MPVCSYIVSRADDAGTHLEANQAIFAAARHGWVRNISLVANGPILSQAVKLSRAVAAFCDFGLHVCLTSEWARLRLAPLSSEGLKLVDAEGFLPRDTHAILERGVSLDLLMAEVRAQYETLVGTGIHVSYLDEHMGCGQLHEPGCPECGLNQCLREFCNEQGLVWFADRHQGGMPAAAFASESTLAAFLASHRQYLGLMVPT